MKKKIIIFSIILCSLFMVGCGKGSEKEVIKNLSNKINKLDAYYLEGKLEITNNEDTYTYDVDVSFQKDDMFRVGLKNTINNHTQILLKNKDGVYVLTPSLNKSFKFQSDWPYNNSQIYLLQTILKDIENDNDKKVEKVNDKFVITSKVNYSNNKDLIKQKVYVDKDSNIQEIQVLDQNDKVLMKMTFTKIDTNPTFDSNRFALNSSLNVSGEIKEEEAVGKIDTIIYPMYLPTNTHLASQDKLSTDKGERVILTFNGDKSFMFIQETASKAEELTTIPTYGEPIHIADSLGAVTDTSVTWYSNGVEYYVTSDNLTKEELVSVASSIGVMPVGK